MPIAANERHAYIAGTTTFGAIFPELVVVSNCRKDPQWLCLEEEQPSFTIRRRIHFLDVAAVFVPDDVRSGKRRNWLSRRQGQWWRNGVWLVRRDLKRVAASKHIQKHESSAAFNKRYRFAIVFVRPDAPVENRVTFGSLAKVSAEFQPPCDDDTRTCCNPNPCKP